VITLKKKRILQFPLRNNRGGIAKYILENWRMINKNEFIFDFLTMDEEIDFHDELISEGCKIHYVCAPWLDREKFISEVDNVFASGYDTVHLHTSRWTGTEFEEIAMKHAIPNVIVHSHNTDIAVPPEQSDKFNRFTERHEMIKQEFSLNWKRYATNLCACSDLAARWLFGDELTETEVHIFKNAIDVDKYRSNNAERERYRHELDLENCFVIGHVGRFCQQKNHEFIIKMFKNISKVLPSSRLLLIGNGPDFEKINSLAQGHNIANHVRLLGLRGDIPELLQTMDVFVLPSLYEGLPISLVEAQASGLKCFVSDKVSSEAQLLPSTHYLPLQEHIWQEALVEAAGSKYKRDNTSAIIEAAGFSIKESVKVLEKLYRGELRG